MSFANELQIIDLAISLIIGYANSARTHSKRQLEKIKKSVRAFGQILPILVDKKFVIIDGHAVFAALQELGYTEVRVIIVENLTEADLRALRLALNRIPQDAGWDQDRLRAELNFLIENAFDLELTGFDTPEMEFLTSESLTAETVEEARLAELEPQGTPVVRPGDVFQLDRHTIACGDALDVSLLLLLLAGRLVAMMFCDPPYNVPIDGFVSGQGKIQHREFAMASGEMTRAQFVTFLRSFLVAAVSTLADGGILFVCMDWRHIRDLIEAAESCDLEFKNLITWVKSNAGMGSFYRSQHELIGVFKHGKAPHQNNFELGQHGRSRTNVWKYAGVNTFGRNRMDLLGAHPTVKPTAMIADAIRDVSRRGDIVLDPFLGSGSTLLAAEETGRTCVGIELDPGYVEVAIRRWEKLTGRDAIHAASGETFSSYCGRLHNVPRALPAPASILALPAPRTNGEADNER